MKRSLYVLAGLASLWVGEWFRHRLGCYEWPRPWYDLPLLVTQFAGMGWGFVGAFVESTE